MSINDILPSKPIDWQTVNARRDAEEAETNDPEPVMESESLERYSESAIVDTADSIDRDEVRDRMQALWGEEYQSNRELINRYLDTMPASRRDWYEGRNEAGALRLNNPEILDGLAKKAREAVPAPLVVAIRQYGDERTALEALMGDRTSPYWKGPHSAALQARYRDLLR